MEYAEINRLLEVLPEEIAEVEKKLIAAIEKYEKQKMAVETQIAIEKVRVQKTKDIPNNFAKDVALASPVIIGMRTEQILYKTKVMKYQAEYDRLDRKFKAVRKMANLVEAEINRGLYGGEG